VHDLVIQERENELVIGTHGRSIWVVDLNPWLDHAGEAIASDWTTEDAVALEWNERWGQKGWAWSEPRTVEVAFDAFAPERTEGQWHWVDSTGTAQSVDERSIVEKGWQTLRVPAQWTTDEGVAFPALGTYQLRFKTASEEGLKGPEVSVEAAD
jgi:hypothetical protein